MQIVDLRQLHSRSLEGLFQEETRRWREELYWDYRPSIDLVRKFIDSHALGGCASLEDGHLTGYGFYVVEEHKGLIGGLFVSSQHAQGIATERLLTEMLSMLRSMPRLERIEAQLMPFGIDLDSGFLSQHFRLHARQFMLLSLDDARLKGAPLSAGYAKSLSSTVFRLSAFARAIAASHRERTFAESTSITASEHRNSPVFLM